MAESGIEIAQHYAERLLASQKLNTGSVYLHGQDAPTRGQVAAVLHALADHTLLMHLSGDDVQAMGEDRANLGDQWQRATGLGRFLQRMGDHLEEYGPARQRRTTVPGATYCRSSEGEEADCG